ncbi:hypothetical protein M885DRAFT_518786 [Pelagophyceae sp. CCMP2097]|nr:hypothetical protein M885DRAFT_518786 [Pelagophyceae sp. CCMP2097]
MTKSGSRSILRNVWYSTRQWSAAPTPTLWSFWSAAPPSIPARSTPSVMPACQETSQFVRHIAAPWSETARRAPWTCLARSEG